MGLLHRLAATIICIALLMVTCVHRQTMPSADIRFQTSYELVLHADTAFTLSERNMLSEVVEGIYVQTAGLLRPQLVYDLDFDSMSSLKTHLDDNLLMRAPSSADYIVASDKVTALTLGLTDVDLKDIDWTQPVKVFLVIDRLSNPIRFKRVAMHELLHAFRLSHVTIGDAVMSPKNGSGFTDPVACINSEDADEICRIYRCDTSRLNYCR